MSAELLREAAALMRERAEAATPGRWVPFGTSIGSEVDGCTCHGGIEPYGHEQYCGIEGPVVQAYETDIQHIASWHPAVALAVAKAMDDVAQAWENCDGWAYDYDDDQIRFEDTVEGGWLAVARAYLGRPS